MKKYIGHLLTFKYADRKSPIAGILIDFNEEWALLKHNSVDYVIDGYIIIKNKNFDSWEYGPEEKFTEKILRLKGEQITPADSIPIDDLKTILTYLTKEYGLFSLETKSEKACYLGKLKSIDSKKLIIKFLDTKGKWGGDMTFRPNEIRTISFNNDYNNSLKLLLKK